MCQTQSGTALPWHPCMAYLHLLSGRDFRCRRRGRTSPVPQIAPFVLSPASGLPAASTSKNVCGTIHAAAATPMKLLLSHKFFLPERHHHTPGCHDSHGRHPLEFVRPVSCSGPADALSAAYKKASGEPLNYGRNYGAKPSGGPPRRIRNPTRNYALAGLLKSPASLHPAAGLSLPYGKSHTNHDRYTTTAAKQTKPIWLIFFRRRNVQIQKGGSRMSRLY